MLFIQKVEVWGHQNGQDDKGLKVTKRKTPELNTLNDFPGTYYSAPLNVNYPVLYENNKRTMKVPATFKTYVGMDTQTVLNPHGRGLFSDFQPWRGGICAG